MGDLTAFPSSGMAPIMDRLYCVYIPAEIDSQHDLTFRLAADGCIIQHG
jgi:hypothetical protein